MNLSRFPKNTKLVQSLYKVLTFSIRFWITAKKKRFEVNKTF